MFVKIECPSCKRGLKVSEKMAGSKRVCPYCKGVIVVPSAPETDALGDFQIDLGPKKKTTPVGAAKKRSVPQSPSAESGANTDASNVSLVTSGLMGLGGAVALYLLLLPLHLWGVELASKFWIPASLAINFSTTLLMFWCFAILFLKWRKLKRQKSAMLMDLLPTEISREITTDSLDQFVRHIRSLPSDGGTNILVNRVLRGIEHFRVRKSAAETVTMMESQSVIDASNVAGSYTIVKVFIWAMPILGFIGTVMGVSNAVSGLSATLSNSGEMGALMDSMQNVFSGLGTAFDTTLLALIMSLIVKIPASALQKSEDDLVTVVDEYCNENLLRRLNDGREGGAERGLGGTNQDAKVFRDAVEAALGTHHAELEKWISKLDAIGNKLTGQVAKGWAEVNEKMKSQQEIQLQKFQQQHSDQASLLQQQLHEMGAAAMEIQQSLAALTEQAAQMQQHVADSMSGSTGALEAQFAGLERGLVSLSAVLESLGEQQVVVQQIAAPRKRGWFK
jgi:hypothetical protein